jgi:D-beta-D-heptose 7-phosphate kinase / D-beta-D-heptose 1-phosphate adenosyltransferase
MNRNAEIYNVKAPAVRLPYVSGAGDTYLAAFVLAFVQSHDMKLSAEIGTAAATIAVRKESTSACSLRELQQYFKPKKFVSSLEELKDLCNNYRSAGKKIVFTNGCFDILHSGHVTYLESARELGDVLIVGVNTDESIKRLKGASRPINHLEDRLQVLVGLTCVSHVIPFGAMDTDTPIPLIRIVKPDIFVKGGDYTRESLPEASTVEEHGGVIEFIKPVPNHSTTLIIRKINGSTGRSKRHERMEQL